MQKAAGLSDVLAAHNEYIGAVERRAMLNRAGAPLLAALHRIFDTVLRFRAVQARCPSPTPLVESWWLIGTGW
jgi:hypothetical protein